MIEIKKKQRKLSIQNPFDEHEALSPILLSNFQDYLTNGHSTPPKDNQNDCMLDEAMQSGGTTTIKYHRKVDTGDSQDIVIEVNCFPLRFYIEGFIGGHHDHRLIILLQVTSAA